MTGIIEGKDYVGGLVGSKLNGIISNSYATSNVLGNSKIGGLVGSIRIAPIYNVDKKKYYLIIQEAINDADSGDTIKVYEGTYHENIIINKSLSLIGAGSNYTIIHPALTQGRTIDIEGEEHSDISVSVSGFTLDHQHFNSTGYTVGLRAQYVDGLHIEDIHAINFGNKNHDTERGGFDIYDVKNIVIKDIVVDSVYGLFTKGMRLTRAENVYFENFEVSNTFGSYADNWMIYMHNNVINGTFTNLSYVNHSSTFLPQPIYLGEDTYNLTFNNIYMSNITSSNNAMFIRFQAGSHNNTFNNFLLENLIATGTIASAIEMTHESRDNVFNNLTIRNINGAIQTRAINLDRGAKYNTFNNVLIDGLNGYTSTNTFGINLNSRSGNTDTKSNLFNNVTIKNINTTGNFFAINLNSLVADYNTKENVFYEIYADIKSTDAFSNSVGYQDTSNGENTIENSYISGFDTAILLDADNITITGNHIINNTIGISITSIGNLIYNNYFNNTDNAFDNSTGNNWNITKTLGTNIIGGEYLGGNYWNDYAGEDTTGDGLGDTLLPYNSNGDIVIGGDEHPLYGNSFSGDEYQKLIQKSETDSVEFFRYTTNSKIKSSELENFNLIAIIKNSYAIGDVNGSDNVGGLVGKAIGNVEDVSNYWNIDLYPTSVLGEGKNTGEMKLDSTFVGWDFENIWGINVGYTYPYLFNPGFFNSEVLDDGPRSSSGCTYFWECTDWRPIFCPPNETQTRECVNKGTCRGTMGMPETKRDCTYFPLKTVVTEDDKIVKEIINKEIIEETIEKEKETIEKEKEIIEEKKLEGKSIFIKMIEFIKDRHKIFYERIRSVVSNWIIFW